MPSDGAESYTDRFMTDTEFNSFLEESLDGLAKLNARCEQEFKLGNWENWFIDLEAATLTFSDGGQPRVKAQVRAVGSSSNTTSTFRWGWANQHLPTVSVEGMEALREFGQREGIEALTWDTLEESDTVEIGWEMTAIAVRVLDGKGSYRVPSGNGHLYLLITEVAFVS